jgi:hypothetical protein
MLSGLMGMLSGLWTTLAQFVMTSHHRESTLQDMLKLGEWSAYSLLPPLLMVIAWWQLLRRRPWAWWLLTIVYVAGLLLLAVELAVTGLHASGFWSQMALATVEIMIVLCLVSLAVLLTDRPANWRAPRTSG